MFSKAFLYVGEVIYGQTSALPKCRAVSVFLGMPQVMPFPHSLFFFLAFLFFILPPASQYWRRWVIWRWKNILWWPHSLEGLSVLSNVSCQCASEEGHAGTSVRLRSYSAPSRDGRGRWLRKHEVLVPPERLCVWSTTQPLSPGACPALSISPQK